MDSNTLARLMISDSMIRKRFLGIYPLDMIPKNVPNNSLIIVNHDRSTEVGSHWIVLHYKENEVVEHFDSTGKPPKNFIHNLLISNKSTYMYNNKRLQSYNSDTCALFCLYYSFYSCRFMSFQNILHRFSSDLSKNEKIVTNFFLMNFI